MRYIETHVFNKIFCSYKCSKCGEINVFGYSVGGTAVVEMGIFNEKKVRQKSENDARISLLENIRKLILKTSSGNYRDFRADYKCRCCGHREKWVNLGKDTALKSVFVCLGGIVSFIIVFYLLALMFKPGSWQEWLKALGGLFIVNIPYAICCLVSEIRYRKIMNSISNKASLPKLTDTKRILEKNIEELLIK